MNGGTTTTMTRALADDRVTFLADSVHPDRFIPQVTGADGVRAFEGDDMLRVMDFESMIESPLDGGLMFCEDSGGKGGDQELRFPMYYFCLRGGYLFYFNLEDVDKESGPYASFYGPPLGVIPLDSIKIEFPPGGRRVFRQHAHTEARKGYELFIMHAPPPGETSEIRPPSFLVADSMSQREQWAKALRERAQVQKPTFLRSGFSSGARARPATSTKPGGEEAAQATAAVASSIESNLMPTTNENGISSFDTLKSKKNTLLRKREQSKSMEQKVLALSDDTEMAAAVVEFGPANFNESEWLDMFFSIHNDFDAPAKCRQLENFQADMKKSLKGAVLEQYEYFVQASGEMTTMGREVSSLKSWIETQVDTLRDMKGIDFAGSIDEILNNTKNDGVNDDTPASAAADENSPRLDPTRKETKMGDSKSVLSEFSLVDMEKSGDDDSLDGSTRISLPDWLEDAAEDVSALIRESRYGEAVEQHVKARNEVSELIDKHENPTDAKLSKSQLAALRSLEKKLEKLEKKLSERLEETLRRKNEALRQASKRERSDMHATVTVVSPCALNDDAMYLQLLVKLGRTLVAAEAYTSRRSLLLLEALQERPISGAGSVDLVIYAAQLSQSFFSCLASSVEGFLDLFLMSQPGSNSQDKGGAEDTDSLAESSLQSHSMKGAPSGAVAAVVLWCDGELSKFATAIGGVRILANLALSPPPSGPRQPRVVGEPADEGSQERKTAIEIAAQCIDQAFIYASQNLDSVGLPLAPRLAEYIRPRLKGCEYEVSQLLDDRWKNLTVDWRNNVKSVPNGSAANGHH